MLFAFAQQYRYVGGRRRVVIVFRLSLILERSRSCQVDYQRIALRITPLSPRPEGQCQPDASPQQDLKQQSKFHLVRVFAVLVSLPTYTCLYTHMSPLVLSRAECMLKLRRVQLGNADHAFALVPKLSIVYGGICRHVLCLCSSARIQSHHDLLAHTLTV